MADKPTKALVVDDSRLARIALSKQLKRRDIEVDVAGDATEALAYLRTQRPDLVFMDYMMPDMDGFQASEQVLALHPDLPIVMYTAQDSEEDHARGKAIGLRGFLSKPSSEDALDELLAALAGAEQGTLQAAAGGAAAAVPISEVPAPAANPGLPWDEIRKVARTAAMDAARRVSNEGLEYLREELDRRPAADPEQLLARAEAAARDGAEEAASAIARRIAEQVSRELAAEAATAAAKTHSLNAVRPELDALRNEVNALLANLGSSGEFRVQVKGVLFEHVLPSLQQALEPELRQAAATAAEQAREQMRRELEPELLALRRQLAAQSEALEARLSGLQRRLALVSVVGAVLLVATGAIAVLM